MISTLKTWWGRLEPLPGGRWLFGKILGFIVPYSGTVSPTIIKLSKGHAELSLKDCRRHRNHLRSLHALAIANVGELTTGLALHFAMGEKDRAILTNLSVDFLKKARGTLQSIANADIPKEEEKGIVVVEAHIYDAQKQLVAKVRASWLLEQVKL